MIWLSVVLYLLGVVMSTMYIAACIGSGLIKRRYSKGVIFTASLIWPVLAIWTTNNAIRFFTTKGNYHV